MSTVTPAVYGHDVADNVAIDTVEVTAYGRPAIEALARRVGMLKGGDPLAPVTVVVTSNHVAVATRRALADNGRGIANVTFLTLHRLAERLGGPALAAAGRRPVSTPVVAAAVRAVLADDPGVFAPVADHPATERALVAAHRELAAAPDDALDPVAACSDRARDVIRIHRAVTQRLAGRCYDESDLLRAAAERIERIEHIEGARFADGAGELGPVVLHALHRPDDLTAAAARLVRALASTTTVAAVVALTGDPAADRAVVAAHARAGIDVGTATSAHDITPACAAEIVSASDPDEEVRAAVRRVTTWMHDGVPLGRVALAYGSTDPYARLLHEQLAAAGIPFNGAPVRGIGDLLLGRTLRALLALPDRAYRRPDVLAVLTGAPLVDREGRRVHSRRWDEISRSAGVVDGDDWDARLTRYAHDERRKADDEAAEHDRRAARRRGNADEADNLRTFLADMRTRLERGHTLTAWSDLVAWAHELIDTYIGADGDAHRATWPDEEQEAAHRVEAALDGLAGLDEVDNSELATLEVFRRTLDGELESSLGRHGRLGDGIFVGPVSATAGLVLDRIAVLGLAEGQFPPRRLDDSLLPDREREKAGGELPLRSRRVDDDRRSLLAAVAVADHAVLSHPRGDLRRNGERPASRWLLADAARLAGCDTVRSGELRGYAGEPWFDDVASFAAGHARADLHVSAQALRLATIARGERTHANLVGDATLAAARHVVRSRRGPDFTRFDGNLTSLAGELGVLSGLGDDSVVSASRLQTWAACPHAYLLQYVLGVDPITEPERRIAIDAVDLGTLVHEILDEFVKGALGADSSDGPRRWDGRDRERLHRIADEKFADAEARGITGRRLLWDRDRARIRHDLDRFVDADNERMAALGAVPVSTERRFDRVPVRLPSGRTLQVRGSVDRIDRAGDGSLVVLDYKTGSTTKYEKLGADDPHRGGTLLQLYVYALAARHQLGTDAPVWAGYWFNTTRRNFARIGYTLTPEIEDEVGRAIDTIVDGITGGVFPAHPAEKPAWSWVDCWFCTPDGLSGAERRRDWERKRAAPELRAYVALTGESESG